MIFKSSYPDVTIPEVSIPEIVLGRVGELGNKPALIDGPSGRTVTYSQLAGAVPAVAAGLSQHGFQQGDVLAIYAPNLPEYAIPFLAVTSLGGAVTGANPLYTVRELVNQLKDAGAKFLLTMPPLMDKAIQAADEAGIQEIFVFGEAPGATPFSALLQSNGRPPRVQINPRQDVAALPYSGGTTGLPKGVMLTHYNMIAQLYQIKEAEAITEDDLFFTVWPFFHLSGLLTMNVTLHTGATLVSMPRFDLEQFLHLLQTYGPNRLFVAPPIVLALARHPLVDKYDLSKLAWILSGAAPLSESVARACAERLGCVVKQSYGMTEIGVTHVTPDEAAQRKPTTVGLPLPNTECKVMDLDSGAELGPNQQGEIWLRGPQMMSGYLNNPEATTATIDADGWLHSGDIGYADEEGYFYIVDRLKELIKYKGFQVAPAELEAVLLTHPAVADAAVIGRPDEEAGEAPKAFVVRRGEVTADALMAYVAGQVAPYKKIRYVEFVDDIPKSPAGKPLRRVLVERERAAVL